MDIKRIVLISFIYILILSCDKPRSIKIYNNLSSKVIVHFGNLEDTLNFNKSISLNPKQSMILLIHGSNGHIFGNWSKEEIEKFSKSVKLFNIIVDANDTFYIDDKNKFLLLLNSKKILFNNSLIKLKIDEDLLSYMKK